MKKNVQEIAACIGASFEGEGLRIITGVNDLVKAEKHEISFFSNPRYHQQMLESKAGAIIVRPDCEREENRTYLIHDDPSAAFQKVLSLFMSSSENFSGFIGIHPTAIIHPTATIEESVTIGPYAVIDKDVKIKKRSFIGSHVYIGPRSSIGEYTTIHPHVVIREDCILENYVIIQPGAIIGSCGYGYSPDREGRHHKLQQLGNVVIKDNVEIGANTTIDRARFQSTLIGEGTKIDNLVQIAHNVEIGKHSLIIAQTGVAGSAKIGNHVILAGDSKINGHLEICDKTRIAACSIVSKSITKPGDYRGSPVMPLPEYNKMAVRLRQIGLLVDRVKKLEMAASA